MCVCICSRVVFMDSVRMAVCDDTCSVAGVVECLWNACGCAWSEPCMSCHVM